MARPELLDRRPGWPAVLRLEPLPESEAGALVGDDVTDEVRERIIRASGGNPLFLTEMAALGDDAEVPGTLRALLAARLDQLDEAERAVLERGAVEGELFHRGTVQALAAEEEEVTSQLAALVRRDLVRPDRPQLPREDAYRFRHLLIRDAAYDALPKATRAELHRRFAEWLSEHGQSLVELDEILGYHLEQAALYLAELGRPDVEVGSEASRRLASAGERARWRNDAEAAHSLLARAVQLVEEPDAHLAIAFAMSHIAARDAERLLDEEARRSDDRSDAAGAALARGLAAQMRLWTGKGTVDDAERLGLAAIPMLEERQDHAGLAQMWFGLAAGAYNFGERLEQLVHAAEIARNYETLAGMPHQRSDAIRAWGLLDGPRPLAEVSEEIDALDLSRQSGVWRATLLVMLDRIDEGRRLIPVAAERAEARGGTVAWEIAEIEDLCGNHDAALEMMEQALDWERERGLSGNVPFSLAWMSRQLALVGRYDEAELCVAQAQEHSARSSITGAQSLQGAALVHAHRGEWAEAEELAKDAVELTRMTDMPRHQATALADLAEVLEGAGRRDEAVAAWEEAASLYEQKGIIPLARRVRERLASLQPV
jgi:tetratricopeptide (TPR) repeat protein